MKRQSAQTAPLAQLYRLNDRGEALLARGQAREALACFRQALALAPQLPPLHANLGKALGALGRHDDAEAAFRRAMALDAQAAEFPFLLGNLLLGCGRTAEAMDCFRQTVERTPRSADGPTIMGIALCHLKRWREAVAHLERAVAQQPTAIEVRQFLGLALAIGERRYIEARQQLSEVLAAMPENILALDGLSATLANLGLWDEALAYARQAVALIHDQLKDWSGIYNNFLFKINYHPTLPAKAIYAEFARFGAKLAPLQRWRSWPNERDMERRLRIGYVSPDFNRHSVRFFLEPLLAAHDKAAVEVVAYAQVAQEDEVTARYRAVVDRFVPTVGMSDEALAERIHGDGIDLLVDLAGMTANNRLGVFARKPAPVSLSWLGFGYTTGLSAIDYFLGDEVMTPPGCEPLFAEQVFRMPAPCFVFRPEQGMEGYEGLPANDNGYLTFATLSRAIRLNERVVRTWAEILRRVDGARLIIDTDDFRDAKTVDFFLARFAAYGIGPERLLIGFHTPPWELLHLMVDIGLDCFPHNSGTTLFEMAYLGIPFITLADRPSVGRIGSTIAHGIGHAEWIAQSEEEYIDKAVALASDWGKLAALRAGLRDEMKNSPLMDEAGFARKVEAAYRTMWQRWCASAG